MASFIVAGVAFHLSTLNVELDFLVLPLLIAQSAVLLGYAGYELHYDHVAIGDALQHAFRIGAYFHFGLWSSTLIHRLFFHRLRGFQGPFPAKVTRLYATWKARNLQYHLETHAMHNKYGDFVRTGPRELSIARASAVPVIYGHQTACTKATWYGLYTNDPEYAALNGLRVPSEHKRRRRAWDRALSTTALQNFEPRIAEKTKILVDELTARSKSGRPLNMADWTWALIFDIMGDIGLGKSLGAIENGAPIPAMEGIREVMGTLGIFATAPWLVRILQVIPVSLWAAIPGAQAGYIHFFKYCAGQLSEKQSKVQRGMEPEDILSYLITAQWEGDKSAPPATALPEDARLLIIAGSDTSATLICNALYYLLRNPKYLNQVTAMLDAAFPNGGDDWTPAQVQDLPMLDDIMHETLRLAPPTPEALTRITPPEGLMIDDVYIPGNIVVGVPPYTIQRDERYWEEPNKFKPERWSDGKLNPETALGYIPFTRGAHTCPGKHLARIEFRMAMSRLLLNFNFSLADEQNAKDFEAGQMHTFTLSIPPLYMNVTPR
ncbi:cytochrome P450 [Flagelloscypha sp. PMI_526]|nr:cytochrome P450 [Flagelloscypha sp. PMI_526]